MAFKFVAFAATLAVVNAGAPIGFHTAHPALTQAYAAAPVATPQYAPAPLGYAAPIAKVAAPLAYSSPIAKVAAPLAYAHDPHPQYSFAYGVEDSLTGDNKNQEEHRDGDVVQGSYSLTDSDGFRRTVKYSADPVNGFNAVVHREPLAVKTIAPVAKVAAPVAAYAAPAYYH